METHWHDLTDLNGVGAVTADRMRALNYFYTENLLANHPDTVASNLDLIDQVTFDEVHSFYIPQARLLRLNNMTGALSSALLKRGITLDTLVTADKSTIGSFLTRDGFDVDNETLLEWQLQATKIKFTAFRLITVLDRADSSPTTGAELSVVNPLKADINVSFDWQTNAYGQALLEYLAPGEHEIEVRSGERKQILNVTVVAGQHANSLVKL